MNRNPFFLLCVWGDTRVVMVVGVVRVFGVAAFEKYQAMHMFSSLFC